MKIIQLTAQIFLGICLNTNVLLTVCQAQEFTAQDSLAKIKPVIITEPVKWDTDDPAIWVNSEDPEMSLIIGTDKNTDGALYAFNLEGKIVKRSKSLLRPNNVDITYGFPYKGENIDIAIVTEREAQRIRVFRLPDLKLIDQNHLVVFNGDTSRPPMGIAIYKRPKDDAFFVFVGGKTGPENGYLYQYRIRSNINDEIDMEFVRSFGRFSGEIEIEAIAVDQELGFVYYSDESVGVRKYHADPDTKDADKELALFANKEFRSEHEGISIYKTSEKEGYIIISDQLVNEFLIYKREGTPKTPSKHSFVKRVKLSTRLSDGNESTSIPLSPQFPKGLFVAMSNEKTFHYYSWKDLLGDTDE